MSLSAACGRCCVATSTSWRRGNLSEHTALLAVRDDSRDGAFVGLRDFVKAFVSSGSPEKAAAGELLVEIFRSRGWSIFSLGYSAETSQLNVLVNDLETPEAQAALTTIGATVWLDDLKTAQGEFETAYQEKVAAQAGEDYQPIRDGRRQVARYVAALLSYVDLQSDLNPVQFGPVVDKIDEVIVDVVTVARARRTRGGNEGDEGTLPAV